MVNDSNRGARKRVHMTKELVWRLSEKPSGDVINRLVQTEIITKEEAKAILFSERDKEPEDTQPQNTEDK